MKYYAIVIIISLGVMILLIFSRVSRQIRDGYTYCAATWKTPLIKIEDLGFDGKAERFYRRNDPVKFWMMVGPQIFFLVVLIVLEVCLVVSVVVPPVPDQNLTPDKNPIKKAIQNPNPPVVAKPMTSPPSPSKDDPKK